MDRTKRRIALVVSAASMLSLAVVAPAGVARPLAAPPGSSGDAVLAWNANAGEAALAACIAPTGNPLHESHLYAMTHVAIHDALNAIDRRYGRTPSSGTRAAGRRTDAAVATAARRRPGPGPRSDPGSVPAGVHRRGDRGRGSRLRGRARRDPRRAGQAEGYQRGARAAAAILALRADDGSDTPLLDFAYPQGNEPGEYRFTPGTPFAFAPGWGDVTPFVLRRQLTVPRRMRRMT